MNSLHLEHLLDAAPDAMVLVDDTGTIVDTNAQTEAMFGHRRSDLRNEALEILVPQRLRQAHVGHVQGYLKDPRPRPMAVGLELLGRRKDGTEFPIEISLNPISVEGRLLVLSSVRDVTERKRVEKELREAKDLLEQRVAERTARLSEERDLLETYLNVAGVVVTILDTDGTIRLMNRTGAELLGVRQDACVGMDWFELFVPKSQRRRTRKTLEGLVDRNFEGIHAREDEVVTRDGEKRRLAWHDTLLRDAAGAVTAILSSGADVTDKRRAEELMRQQENLAQLGKMAAVVAHEIKNPLAGITGAVQVIRDELPVDSPSCKIADEVIARTGALGNTLDDILSFARPTRAEPVPIPIKTLLQDAVSLFGRDTAMKDVGVVLEGENPIVLGDVQHLNQVFLNLLLNAGQAMDGRGRVLVNVTRNNGCHVSVRDHGPGIADDMLGRVFEPFFTTKHRGTGLGLPTCRRMVEAHGGRITLGCLPEGGTEVRVRLPLSQKDEAEAG